MHYFPVSGEITLLYIFSWNFILFDKRSTSQCKFPGFRLLTRKMAKFLVSFFRPRVTFHVDCFHHCSVSWITPLYFCSSNLLFFGQKDPIKRKSNGAMKVPNLRLSISQNLYFDRLFLLKVYKISAKKVQRSYVSWHWRMIQNLKKNQFGEFWSKHSKDSKIYTSIGPFCAKYITFDLRKYKGVIFHDTEGSSKIWKKKNGLWFGKWPEEFGKFSPEHLKVSPLIFSWDPFVQSRKCIG